MWPSNRSYFLYRRFSEVLLMLYPTQQVFIGALRSFFIRSMILLSAEALTTGCRPDLRMMPSPPLSRVKLVSPSPPLYTVWSLSVQTTATVPQAVVTTFTFRLERASTFSGELLESCPRQPLVPPAIQASSQTGFNHF